MTPEQIEKAIEDLDEQIASTKKALQVQIEAGAYHLAVKTLYEADGLEALKAYVQVTWPR